MPDLKDTVDSIKNRLDDREKAREIIIQSSRGITRSCRSAIASIHAGKDPSEHLSKARNDYESLRVTLDKYPDFLFSGFAIMAQQELAEAEIIEALLSESDFPTPENLGITDDAFVGGLADAIGEMRRIFLKFLMMDEVEKAETILARMEDFFNMLMTFDFPDALIPARKKQDIARRLLEKSRGELAMARQMMRLRKEISSRK